jgi:hypothetical protein
MGESTRGRIRRYIKKVVCPEMGKNGEERHVF